MTKERVRGSEDQIVELRLSEIEVSPSNVRKHGASADLDELAESIRELGLLQPVVVTEKAGAGKFELIVGQRRFLAHKRLGKSKIRAVVVKPMSRRDALIRSLVENVHRVDLNEGDAVEAVTDLYHGFDEKARAVARATGLSLRRVNRYLRIKERASEEAIKLLKQKKVRSYDVKRALDLAEDDPKKADRILRAPNKMTLAGGPRWTMSEAGGSPLPRSTSWPSPC